MRSYYLLGLAVAALIVPQDLGAQPQDRSGLSIFPQSPAPEQLVPSSPPPDLVFDQSYEYVGEVEYFDDSVIIDRRRFSYPSIRRSYRAVIPRFSSVPYFYPYRRSPGIIIKFGAPIPTRRFHSQPFRRSYGYFYNRFRH